MFDLFGNPQQAQGTIEYPAPLTERYRPHALDEFAGLAKVKPYIKALIARPKESNWLFVGPSGTGKTTMARAIAEAIGAEVHHIGSQECNLARLGEVVYSCWMVPMMGKHFHMVLVDEADLMSTAAQNYLLSKLDGTATIPNTIWVFTCNDADRLETRFRSRCFELAFSNYAISSDASKLLERIWTENVPHHDTAAPNFARMVKDANGNVREALMKLELELMAATV
jgi:putative ATPase